MSGHRKTIKRTHANRPSGCGSPFRFPGCVLASCTTLASLALAAENPGAHEHGQARLRMALENSRIDLMFTSPAYNLAGFEYEARTDDENRLLTDINHWLASTPLINNVSGACTVAAVTVELGGGEKSHQGDEATHRDYDVAQHLTCEGISASDIFQSPLTARFPELEELTIEWAGPGGQGSTVITPESRSFSMSQ